MVIAWQDYLQNIAEKNKIVAHGKPSSDPGLLRVSFVRNNNFEELEAASVSGLHSPYVVCGPIGGQPVGQEPGLRKRVRTVIYFMAHSDDSTDQLESVQETTYQVMSQFIACFRNDFETKGACGPFTKIDLAKMSFQQIGPISQGDYGWRLHLEFIEKAPELLFNATNWF